MPGCPACAALDVDVVHALAAWGAFRVARCRRCGLVRTEPQPDRPALLAAYRERQKSPAVMARVRRRFARAFAARAARGLSGPGGRALDVGCGDGSVLAALVARGFTGLGTELPGRGCGSLAPGVRIVETEDVTELRLPAASFRLVVLRHALEHLGDPAAALREVRRVLEPSGRLVVAVPNLASWQARWTGPRWVHLDVPRHLFHFTPETLGRLVRETGFAVERVTQLSFEHGSYGWLCAAVRGLAETRRPPTLAGAFALSPLGAFLSLAEALAGRGAVIELAARPDEGGRAPASAHVS